MSFYFLQILLKLISWCGNIQFAAKKINLKLSRQNNICTTQFLTKHNITNCNII